MAYFTTSIAVVAGLCLAVSLLYLFIASRRPADRVLNLRFALFALLYAGAILTARSSYMADTLNGFASANATSVVFAALGLIAFLWFVAAPGSPLPPVPNSGRRCRPQIRRRPHMRQQLFRNQVDAFQPPR